MMLRPYGVRNRYRAPSWYVGGDLTVTGNTILGDAQTDTLNVGNGDIIKNASGITGFGVTPGAWESTAGSRAIQVGNRTAVATLDTGTTSHYMNNARYDGANMKYLESATALIYSQTLGKHQWRYAPSGTAGNTITFVTAMQLNTDGVHQVISLQATALTASMNMTIPSDCGVYVPSRYEIPAANTVEIAATAVFEIGG